MLWANYPGKSTMGERNLRLTVAYDGTHFLGWQSQGKGRTVQGTLTAALERMHHHPVVVHAAGRTDSGVHAIGQVVNFVTEIDSIPADRMCLALNQLLPIDLRVSDSAEAHREFHARFDARRRTYRYNILTAPVGVPHLRLYSHRVIHQLDLVRLNRLAAPLIGEHDFTTFAAPSESSPSKVREVYSAAFHAEGPLTVFTISANGFLWRMVRSIVGTILKLAQQNEDAEALRAMLEAQDRSLVGPTAPPQGLFLYKVDYDE